jgi:hypothetical protein
MKDGSFRIVSIALLSVAGVGVLWMVLAALGEGEKAPVAPLVVAASDEIDHDLVVTGQSVEVVGKVQGGVLVFGGDVTITGKVGGDVAVIGGSVYQPSGHVRGDVLVVGGRYNHDEIESVCRVGGTVTVYSNNHEGLKSFFSNPARELLLPSIDRDYVGKRIAAALLRFLLALCIVAIVPKRVSVASERLVLDPLRIAAIGLVGTAVIVLLAGIVLVKLPPLGAAVFLAPLLIGLLAIQVFGFVVVYFLVGRSIQRRLLGERSRSHAVALLLGVLVLAIAGSLPVVGALVLSAVFVVSIGMALTAWGLPRPSASPSAESVVSRQ